MGTKVKGIPRRAFETLSPHPEGHLFLQVHFTCITSLTHPTQIVNKTTELHRKLSMTCDYKIKVASTIKPILQLSRDNHAAGTQLMQGTAIMKMVDKNIIVNELFTYGSPISDINPEM